MNLPNKLTILRILLVPVFLVFLLLPGIPMHYLWAFLIFTAASLTDRYDGKIARERNQITDFGKFLDPLADKILVISALVSFLQLGLANVVCVLIIIAREFMVTSIRLVAADNGVVIAANRWGKTKTVSQIIAIVFILVVQSVRELLSGHAFLISGIDLSAVLTGAGSALIWVATFFTVLSGIIYLKQNSSVINTTK